MGTLKAVFLQKGSNQGVKTQGWISMEQLAIWAEGVGEGSR